MPRSARLIATPRIRTDRLDFDPLEPDDAVEMVGVLADPALYSYIGGEPPTLDALATTYHRWAAGSPRAGEAWHNWVIRLREGGAAIGHLQATVVEVDRSADIGWIVGTAWQGQGYATEAAQALVRWLQAKGVPTITALVHPANLASARVAEHAGLAATEALVEGEVVWRLVRPLGP